MDKTLKNMVTIKRLKKINWKHLMKSRSRFMVIIRKNGPRWIPNTEGKRSFKKEQYQQMIKLKEIPKSRLHISVLKAQERKGQERKGWNQLDGISLNLEIETWRGIEIKIKVNLKEITKKVLRVKNRKIEVNRIRVIRKNNKLKVNLSIIFSFKRKNYEQKTYAIKSFIHHLFK